MKFFQTILLVCLVVGSASAQRSDVKGPKAKNMKVYQNPELFAGRLSTRDPLTLKGPDRKNFSYASLSSTVQPVALSANPQVNKGPKAKNRKPWK